MAGQYRLGSATVVVFGMSGPCAAYQKKKRKDKAEAKELVKGKAAA
eukprot:gene16684-28537_t